MNRTSAFDRRPAANFNLGLPSRRVAIAYDERLQLVRPEIGVDTSMRPAQRSRPSPALV
jgi:hypothetical protein